MAEVEIELLDEGSYESMRVSVEWDCTEAEAEEMMRVGPPQALVKAVLDGLSVMMVSVRDLESGWSVSSDYWEE